jgi:hypothetical protein
MTTNEPGGASVPPEEARKRGIYGYPAEISLAEAVRLFNEETGAWAARAGHPPLTQDELVAAIVAGADYGKQGEVWRAQKEVLWDIAVRKKMPKGSLLIAESGGRLLESPLRPEGAIEPKGIRITLLLGLDRNNMLEGVIKPEQALLIRKTYSRVDEVG